MTQTNTVSKRSNIDLFLDYFNNFLSVEAFANHYGLNLLDAQNTIDAGRIEHELRVKALKALKTYGPTKEELSQYETMTTPQLEELASQKFLAWCDSFGH